MIGNGLKNTSGTMSSEENENIPAASSFCRDFIRGCCSRDNCRFIHEIPPKTRLKELFRFCHDYQNIGCYRSNCKFLHISLEKEEQFYATGVFPRDLRNVPAFCQAAIQGACSKQDCKSVHVRDASISELGTKRNAQQIIYNHTFPLHIRDNDSPPEAKFRRYAIEDPGLDNQTMQPQKCQHCDVLDHRIKILHDNLSVLLKKAAELTEKNVQLTSMNEFLLEQTASIRSDHQSCVITSRHGTSAPVSLATVSVTPVVSLAGAIPALMPTAATPNLTLAPAASQAQLLTPAPQILTVSTTQQLVGNSGALIVTSAGAQQLMQVSDSGTLMGGGQTVVAVTPAQLTLAPPTQQLMSNAPQTAVQQLVQTSALQPQLGPQHQASQFAAQQSVQHLAQSAQHLAAQQSAQHLAAQQSAQHLAQSAQHLAVAQQSAQQLAAQQSAQQIMAQQSAQQAAMVVQQQSAQQQLVPSAQQLVHQTSTQQITISSTSQPLALPNSQAQPLTFPIISQSMLPH